MYYPEELIQEIRERNDIVGVISEYVTLTRKGHNYFGVCPFHNEKTPSFSVNAQEQYYHCFGCGAGGNVYTFLMQIDNMNFVEAVKALADRAHMDLPEAELSPQEKKRLMRRNRLLEITTEAARYFYYQLTRTEPGQARSGISGLAESHRRISKTLRPGLCAHQQRRALPVPAEQRLW